MRCSLGGRIGVSTYEGVEAQDVVHIIGCVLSLHSIYTIQARACFGADCSTNILPRATIHQRPRHQDTGGFAAVSYPTGLLFHRRASPGDRDTLQEGFSLWDAPPEEYDPQQVVSEIVPHGVAPRRTENIIYEGLL